MKLSQPIDSNLAIFGSAFLLIANALLLPFIGASLEGKARLFAILAIIFFQVIITSLNFMHLKHDAKKLWFIICPTLILGGFLILALLPDTIFDRTK